MKKLLVAVLAFALFAPAFAVENVKITGDIQTIGLALDGQSYIPVNIRTTTNRVLFGVSADLVEDVNAKITFAHENHFGADRNYKSDNIYGESVDDFLDNTRIAEAYVNISNVFDALEVKVGRQFYGDEKSAVMYFGPSYGYADPLPLAMSYPYGDYNSYLSADGVTATYRGDNLALTASYFTLSHDNSLILSEDKLNLAGLDLDYRLNDNLKANAYVYDVRQRSVESWGFWGIKPTLETDNLKAQVEYARNYGATEKGWMLKADVALPLEMDNWTLTPRATYLKSEKHFVAFGNYRPGLMFGTELGAGINNYGSSYAGIEGEVLNIGTCMKFANLEKWNFGLDFYTAEMNDMFMGNSWEAKVVYDLNQYVAFNLTGAMLTNAGHSWTHSPTAVQLGMNIKF